MLFELDESVIEDVQKYGINFYINQIEILLSEHFSGYHYLYAGRSKLNVLITEFEKSSDEVNLNRVRRLKSTFATYGSIVDALTVKVLLVGEKKVYERYINDNVQIIQFPISKISDRINEVFLLGENISDAKLFKFLSELAIRENLVDYKAKIRMLPTAGGGGTTGTNFEEYIKSKIVYCITDSDKKTTNSKLGETAKNVERIIEKKSIGIYNHTILPMGEKENIFSPSIYKRIVTDPKKIKLLEILEKLETDSEKYEKLLYFDFKSGYKKKHYEDENIQGFFNEIFKLCKDFLTEEVLLENDEESRNKNILDGLGDKITEMVRTEIEKQESGIFETRFFLKEVVPTYVRENILEIVNDIICWTCCPPTNRLMPIS